MQIKEENADKTKIKDLSSTMDESQKNDKAKASGSNLFDTSNSVLRNRQRQRSNVNDQIVNRRNLNRLTSRGCSCFIIFLIGVIIIFKFYPFKHTHKEGIKEDTDSIFKNMARIADSTSKELSELDIPETSVMNKYRAVFLNLGAILNNSDVIFQNGAQIARVLFKLSDDFKNAENEISNFVSHADYFFYSLSSELNAIKNRLNKQGFLMNYFQHETDGEFIRARLKVLENNVPGFQAQLKLVIDALQLIEQRSTHTQGYLITGEKEAQKVLRDHWKGDVSANYEERKRAEEERQQVLHVLQLLKEMVPNLLDFQSFLNRYRKELQDIQSQINKNRVMLNPSKETLKDLIRAAEKLETSHKNFEKRENQLGQKPKNTLYLEDEMNAMNRDCTEFDIQFTKPNNVYLRKLRIWSSHFINALGFFYSDDSVEIFGTPGTSEAFDFEWHKDEKIKRFEYSFASIVYGVKIVTTRGRSTGWHGGNGGHRFYTEMEGRKFNGLFGSFSKYICSLEVSHG